MRLPYLAICDSEEEYTKRLVDYFCQNKEYRFRIGQFSQIEEMEEYSKNNSIEILLISESMYPLLSKKVRAQLILLLDEGGGTDFLASRRIYKYQAAGKIWKELLCCISKEGDGLPGQCSNKKTKLISYFSPFKQNEQTRVAFEYAKKMSEKERVLFLSLDSFSSIEMHTNMEFTENLTDLLYFTDKDTARFSLRLASAVCHKEQLDILPPVMNVEDLWDVEKEKWLALLDKIKQMAIYDRIVLDLKEPVKGFMDILCKSEQVMELASNERENEIIMRKYESVLKMTGHQEVMEITKKIVMPKEREESNYKRETDCMPVWDDRLLVG